MKSLEEKKKEWDAKKAQKIAERMAKAVAWRAKEEARKLKKLAPVLPGPIEKPISKKKVVKSKLEKIFQKKKRKKRKPRLKEKKIVKPKLKKIPQKSGKRKKPKPKKKVVVEIKPSPIPVGEIAEKVKEEIRKPINALRKELKKKIEEISAVKAGLKLKKIKKRGRPKKKKVKPKAEKEIVKSVEMEKELVAAILEEPLPEEKPKIEKAEEKKPVETATLVGHFTEISMPKIKEEKEFEWGARRFKELEEKLKKLRRF